MSATRNYGVILPAGVYRAMTEERRRAVAALARVPFERVEIAAGRGLPVVFVRSTDRLVCARTAALYMDVATLGARTAAPPSPLEVVLFPLIGLGIAWLGYGSTANQIENMLLGGVVLVAGVGWTLHRMHLWELKPRRASVVILSLFACSSKPADLAGFDGCWHDALVLEASPHAQGLVPTSGSGAVLGIEAEWGGSWVRTDMGQYASLMIQVPPEPVPGQVLNLRELTAQYREGGLTPTYETTTLDGTLEIVSGDANAVRVRINATPTSPSVNTASTPPIALSGEILLPRVAGMQHCR